MKILCVLCCLSLALPAFAPVRAQPELGRLFFTHEERMQMEFERDTGRQRARLEARQKEPPPLPKQVQINGLVLRSSGPNTVWINGSQNPQPGLQPNLEALHGAEIPVQWYGQDFLTLKPGQRLSTDSGAVMEGFNAGQ